MQPFISLTILPADRTQHLLWRLTEGGEIPPSLNPDVVVLLIGTNNLPRLSDRQGLLPVLDGLLEIIKVLRNALPNTVILLNDIFPRSDATPLVSALVSDLNHMLSRWHRDKVTRLPLEQKFIKLLHCGDLFLSHVGGPSMVVNTTLMPDSLHPSAAGIQLWLSECILPVAVQVIGKKQGDAKSE